jgi:Integrase core domain
MVRTECLDWMPILAAATWERILRTYSSHYNAQRPHRGLDLETPEPRLDPAPCLAGEAVSGGATCCAPLCMRTSLRVDS